MARRSPSSKAVANTEPLQFIVGSARLTLEPSGKVTIEGKEIIIKASGNLTMQAGGKLVIKAPDDIAIKGGKIESN